MIANVGELSASHEPVESVANNRQVGRRVRRLVRQDLDLRQNLLHERHFSSGVRSAHFHRHDDSQEVDEVVHENIFSFQPVFELRELEGDVGDFVLMPSERHFPLDDRLQQKNQILEQNTGLFMIKNYENLDFLWKSKNLTL